MTLIVEIIAGVLVALNSLMSVSLFLRAHWPAAALWIIKLYVSALSPLLAFAGVLSTIMGIATGSTVISIVGAVNALTFLVHTIRVTRQGDPSTGFEKAFGLRWIHVSYEKQNHFFLANHIAPRLPSVPEAQLTQNVSFSTVPETNRRLLCDIWRPHDSITSSGLAFIYLHGSAWYMLDKDCGTRTFFSQLAAQGHVVMDVAYRLAPETNMMGMVHDVKRAIVWMKENADTYGLDPDRVVVCGGSAGGHLALLAAYTANDLLFTPNELKGKNMSASAVISLYGPTNLEAMYYHTNQHLTTRSVPGIPKKPVPTKIPDWMKTKMGEDYHRLGFDKSLVDSGALAPLMGGHPDECPGTYSLFSPVNHVHADCPPTLLIHGEHDVMAPVESTRSLYRHLVEKGVPAVLHTLPQTDHAFDLILPKVSPSAHNALYDIEHFLALMAQTNEEPASQPGVQNVMA